MMNPIRLLLVDDSDVIRTAVALYLSTYDELQTIGEAKHGREAIELTHLTHPDVIVMDLIMPVMDGITATSLIHRAYPQLPILVLTSSVERDLLQAIEQAGAVGYLSKHSPVEHLVTAIRRVCAPPTPSHKSMTGVIPSDPVQVRRLPKSRPH